MVNGDRPVCARGHTGRVRGNHPRSRRASTTSSGRVIGPSRAPPNASIRSPSHHQDRAFRAARHVIRRGSSADSTLRCDRLGSPLTALPRLSLPTPRSPCAARAARWRWHRGRPSRQDHLGEGHHLQGWRPSGWHASPEGRPSGPMVTTPKGGARATAPLQDICQCPFRGCRALSARV